jgi:carbon monoxide dehydrogenase subunit G
MLIEGQFKVQAPIQKVWESLMDPKTLGTCMPGTEKHEAIDDKTFESVNKRRVGPIKVKLNPNYASVDSFVCTKCDKSG